MTVSCLEQAGSLIAQADRAMARGDIREAASLLEVAAQRGRDTTTLLRLATVRRSLGDLSGALQAATAGVELSPRNFLMCLLLGSLREATGAIHAAQRAYRLACAHAPLDLSFQPAMARQLEWARRRAEAAEEWRRHVLDWDPAEASCNLSREEERRIRGFRTNILENIDSGPIAPPVFMVPGIRSKRYFEAFEFEGVPELEAATQIIRDEFLALAQSGSETLASRLSGLHAADTDNSRPGQWSMIPLIKNGARVEQFASRCPKTMEVAAQLDLPRLGLISPSLYFSVLEPNSRIAPHTGITNARLIAHLPLIVPDDCGFRVGGEERRWEVGKTLVFDDMTVHEAWNDSDRIRVVLIADLWRPELSAAERAAVTDLMNCRDVAAA
ncbi:MAG TPA: aspartyl/asparaginyl beta-hydroxylase domain-containing protein [Sphingomicrobium sp.]|nr:aspartyl/asparaginyl beta-hydroxylase domain-containing protein [Sphingomicrobium sp.]